LAMLNVVHRVYTLHGFCALIEFDWISAGVCGLHGCTQTVAVLGIAGILPGI